MTLMDVPRHRVADDELVALARTAPKRLIDGHLLTCPGCLEQHDVLAYRPFNYNADYAGELVVVLRCGCGHIFALRPEPGGP